MARFHASALLAIFFFAFFALAAPVVETRQVGNLTCNVARLRIVGALAATNDDVSKISTADATAADAVATAQSGLSSAGDGIKTIAGSILTGQQAPASARDQVGQGLIDAQTALQSIDGTDPAVTTALGNMAKAIKAGQDVVANCK
ncbi:hypothetical protein BDN71DRAFT_1443648 [Pleurotus eryngii]|uniref:Uncharacterized protein n=1 Tax=Pleurotus eryngii TaxID=5323 RepID=A0A9P6A3F3_PLEER|nr:hypothetical protein BDN71DRAFT_1443648 [Pleurotus eryngii]